MGFARTLAIFLPLAALGAAPAGGDPVAGLAGRYSTTFPNALQTGEKYTSENIVEIYPVSRTAAYLRVHTEWANGHSCTLWGVATAEPGGLVYRAPPGDGAEGCVLSIRHVGGHLRMNDEVGEHCRSDCGARGTFDNVDLPFSSRRRIRYGARLEASWQFKETIAAWRKRAVPGQAIR